MTKAVYSDEFISVSRSLIAGWQVLNKRTGATYAVPQPLAHKFEEARRALRKREAELFPRYHHAEAFLFAEFAALAAAPKGFEFESYLETDPDLHAENAVWSRDRQIMTASMVDQRGGLHPPTARTDDFYRREQYGKARGLASTGILLSTIIAAYLTDDWISGSYVEIVVGLAAYAQLALLAFVPDRIARWIVPSRPRSSSYRKTQK